jgi:glutamate--cysteine ligase
LLVWLAAAPGAALTHKTQVQAVQNFKNAAHYDLKTVKIVLPDGTVGSVVDVALQVLARMNEFYRDFPASVLEVLAFEEGKFLDPEQRYAWQVREHFSGGFVQKGLELAERRQEEAVRA